jgi:RNA recognition motif-containing protein
MKIYVGNLSYGVTEEELQEQFGAFGAIVNVNIIKDRETGNSKGFGFIEMENQADGEKAIKELDGSSIKGRDVKVNEARPREERSRPKPRRW